MFLPIVFLLLAAAGGLGSRETDLVAGLEKTLAENANIGPYANRESLVQLLHQLDNQDRSKMHIKGSMDRRRFFGNNKDACEASGSSDATNSDCYEKRWNMLSDYYTVDTGLKKADRKMLITEYETEGILQKALAQLERNADMVAGNDGTLSTPSVTNGLIHESVVLKNATAQLQRASIASVDALYASVINVTQTSISGTKQLKTNIAASFGDLMGKVNEIAAKQEARATNNSATMITDANAALKKSITSVQAQQSLAAGVVANGTLTSKAASSGFASSSTKLTAKLSDAQDIADAVTDGVEASGKAAGDAFADKVADAAQSVADTTDAKVEDMATQGEKMTESFKEQSSEQMDQQKQSWSATVGQVSDEGKAKLDATESAVTLFADNTSTSIASTRTSVTDAISSTTSSLKTKSDDATKSTSDVSSGAASVSSTVTSGIDTAKSTAQETATSAESAAAENKKKLQDLIIAAAKASGQSVQSILSSLGGAQADAQNNQANSEAEQQEAINQFLSQLGNDNSKVASVLGNLQSMVSSGTSAAQNEVNSAMAGAQGSTASSGAALEGKLDSTSSSLANSENQFNAKSTAAQQEVNGQVASGNAATAAAVVGLQNSNGQVSNELKMEMLKSMGFSEEEVGLIQKSLADLTHALQSTGAENKATETAAKNIGAGVDDSLANALFGVSDSDDDVAENIAKEVKLQQASLNQFGSSFASMSGTDVKKLWEQISTQLGSKERENDKIVSQSEQAEKSSLSTIDRVAGQSAALLANTESLVADAEAKSQLARSDFTDRLNQMAAKDSTTITNFQGMLNGYENEAMGDVSGFLESLISGKSLDISKNLSLQKSELGFLTSESGSTGAMAEKMNAVVAALNRNAASNKNGLIDGLLKMLDAMQTATTSFGFRIGNVHDQFGDVKAASAKGLSDLLQSVQTEVLKIPQILTSGAVRLQNDFKLASNDLENNILKLKEKMATAQTDEEKEEAMQGLIVLNKLQGLQQGVLDADAQLRKDIEAGGQAGMISSGNVQGAMTGVLAAMSSINSQMDTTRMTVRSDTEQLGKQTATLVNGMGLMVNQTADQLAHEAAQSAVEARFNLNMAQARNKVRTAAAGQGVNRTLGTFTSNANTAFANEGGIHQAIQDLQSVAKSSSSALGSRIDSVLNEVLSQSAKVQSDASLSDSDVLTRLALVRVSMANFLGLWNEYAATMDRKFKRFHSTDSEFISHMERDIRARLGGSEVNVNETVSKLSGLKKDIELSMQEEIEFENLFTSKVLDVRAKLKDINTERNLKTIQSNQALNDFSDFETANDSDLKESIKGLIDKFDNAVSDRTDQVSLSPEIKSVGITYAPDGSLSLMQDIQELDKRARQLATD